jgi:hypothetical protein
VEADPIMNDAKYAVRQRRSRCAFCGSTKRLEKHHVCGRKNEPDFTILLCHRCHDEEHERLRDAGVSMQRPETIFEFVGNALLAIGEHLKIVAEYLIRWANALLDSAAKLCPACRSAVETP